MRRHGLWWAALLVMASNLGAWGFAALNRSAEPEAVLELTERELRLPPKQADNTALALTLVFERPRPAGGRRLPREAGWFDQAKLQSIGFDCRRPLTKEHAPYYRTRLPRATYAALEFEGDLWRAQMAEPVPDPVTAPEGTIAGRLPLEGLQDSLETRARSSHLVAVDVDNDAAALRARHPDRRRVAVVEATAELLFVDTAGQAPFLAGRVMSVMPGDLSVPREWLTLLSGLQQTEQRVRPFPPTPHEPRYRVTVKWGKNLEPWIADVQPIATLMTSPPAR